MKLQFNLNNETEMPELILGKRNYDKKGSITNIEGFSYDYQLMSANTISFIVRKILNNNICSLWDELKDRSLVWLKEFNEWFEITVKIDESNELQKTITGISLCEAELGQINIVGTQINTEEDIEREDYLITKFYNPANVNSSLLHRIFKKAPHYKIKNVDASLHNLQRSFSIDGTSIYDFLTGELAKEIGCLFLFDSTDRSISVYDLNTNCNQCGYRGEFLDMCPECGSLDLASGYGYDTSIMIDSENLAKSISLEGKSDEVKNYFRIEGGDNIITAAVAACNPSGTNYIYNFSADDKLEMSISLYEKLEMYYKLYESIREKYMKLMKDLYEVIDQQIYLESGMMPDITHIETTALKELAKLTTSNLSPVSVTDVSYVSVYTVNNAVLSMAKCIVNSSYYKITLIDNSTSLTSQTWKGKFRVENYNNENDFAESTNYVTISVNDDYENFIKQKIQKTIDRSDKYILDLFDKTISLSEFKTEIAKYCLNRLTSFESAYQSIIDVLIEGNCANIKPYSEIYNSLYLPYYNKLCAIQSEIKTRTSAIELIDKKYNDLIKKQKEYHASLNLEKYLGEHLWTELCSFIREDVYENSNYISDGLNNIEIFEKAEELLNIAQKESITASTTQWVLSASMHNLLCIPEFKYFTDNFEGGNWIRIKINDNLFRLRLVHYSIDFSDLQSIEVEFSHVTKTSNGLSDVNNLMTKVQSMATSFNYIAHQAKQGEKGYTKINQIQTDGLDLSLYNISNTKNQDFIIDEHGLLGRKYDDIISDYSPEQLKISNNLLVYTDDRWKTAKTALGKINYYNPILKTDVTKYGLLTDTVIAGELIGNDIIGGNIYSENYSDNTGSYIDLNNGNFSFAGGNLKYNSSENIISFTGKITTNSGSIGDFKINNGLLSYNNTNTTLSGKKFIDISIGNTDYDEYSYANTKYTTILASDYLELYSHQISAYDYETKHTGLKLNHLGIEMTDQAVGVMGGNPYVYSGLTFYNDAEDSYLKLYSYRDDYNSLGSIHLAGNISIEGSLALNNSSIYVAGKNSKGYSLVTEGTILGKSVKTPSGADLDSLNTSVTSLKSSATSLTTDVEKLKGRYLASVLTASKNFELANTQNYLFTVCTGGDNSIGVAIISVYANVIYTNVITPLPSTVWFITAGLTFGVYLNSGTTALVRITEL